MKRPLLIALIAAFVLGRLTHSYYGNALRAVREDAPWELVRRTDGKIARTVSARELWDQIGHAAWACADPGIQFHDTVNAWHTCPEDGAIRGSNPCSAPYRPGAEPR